jgi:dinuclear metal center YbgI/SA1388 family protein
LLKSALNKEENNVVALQALVAAADELLQPANFRDYCPNGLQVEGRAEVQRLVTGVTASQKLIDAAIAAEADAILVHHGYFWKGEDPCLIGMKGKRLAALLKNNISLIAYHLPLDAHKELGNNAQLADKLGIDVTGELYPGQPGVVGSVGQLAEPLGFDAFSQLLAERLQRQPLSVSGGMQEITTVAWCTGAAQDFIDQAVAMGVDAFVSGEISERTVHVAEELGIHYFAAGHHATERYGVQALGERLAQHFQLSHQFIDIDNPV